MTNGKFLVWIGGMYLKPFVWITNRLNRENTIIFHKFEFDKSLAHNFWKYRSILTLSLFYKGITGFVQATSPILILDVFARKDWNLLIWYCGFVVMLKLLQWILARNTILTYNSISGSLVLSSHLYWITRDPITFATKSSGESIAKLERAERSLFTILNKIMESFPSYAIQLGVTAAAFWSVNFWFGIGFVVSVFVVVILNAAVALWKNHYYQSVANVYFDKEKELLIENLTKYETIRSAFSTDSQIAKSRIATNYSLFYDLVGWRLWQHGSQLTEMVFVIGIFCSAIFISKNPSIAVSPIFAGAFVNLFLFVKDLRFIGNDISEFSKAYYNLKQFQSYMTSFGKNTIIKDSEYETTT